MPAASGWLIVAALAASACSSRYLNLQIQRAEVDLNQHVGFVLYNPATQKTLFDHQGDRYFTPASNTKIFTFYASLKILGDSIPAIHYVKKGDSLIFWGTGDPSFLYDKVYKRSSTFDFLKRQRGPIFFSSSNFKGEHYGPGWAWDDYTFSYQVERTPMPMYGNQVKVRTRGNLIQTVPNLFRNEIFASPLKQEKPAITREIHSNRFTVFSGEQNQDANWEMPFQSSDDLLIRMLSDTLMRAVWKISTPPLGEKSTFYSVASDSLYKVMMQESDNFIAEQLLLLCADKVSDTLRSEIAIRYAKKNLLADLPDEPVWIDGSGLSRYNLFTPRSIVMLWRKIYESMPRERLFPLLAIGGKTGTLKNYYKAHEPYIFGKTGSLNNHHTLSGYLVTRSGKTLIFSWMNDNFVKPTANVRTRMENVLKMIYEKY